MMPVNTLDGKFVPFGIACKYYDLYCMNEDNFFFFFFNGCESHSILYRFTANEISYPNFIQAYSLPHSDV